MDKDGVMPAEDSSNGHSPLLLILLGGILLVCLLIGIQAFGILYSIAFPPAPPVPHNVTEVRHTPVDHGVDEWLYRTNQDACDIVRYYEAQGGECRMVAGACDDETTDTMSMSSVGQHVATCLGEVTFNIFAYRWEANIANGYAYEDGGTQFSLLREVFWTGSVPPRLDPRSGFEFEG